MAFDKRAWERRLKIGPHYAMERFTIMVCSCALMFVVLGVWGFRNQVKTHSETFASQSLYTGGFGTSLNGITGSVLGVFTNETHTDVALLFRFGDMSRLSGDINDYYLMLSAQEENGKVVNLESNPTANIYMYGRSTGYFVATYHNDEPFPCQILDAFFVNSKPVTVDVGQENTAKSLADYDTWTIIFNPGATGTYRTAAFDSGKFDPALFYNEVVAARQEQLIYQSMNQDLYGMADALAQADEYIKRLETAGINVKEQIPEWVSGDMIIEQADGSHELVTSTIAPGGFDFDWQHGNIADGYVDRLMRGQPYSSSSDYLAAMVSSQRPFTFTPGTWRMQSGDLFSDIYKLNASAEYEDIANEIASLELIWQGYAVLKNDYQITQPTALLQLEITTRDYANNYQANTNEGILRINQV